MASFYGLVLWSFDGPVGRSRAREGTCANRTFTRHWRCGSLKLALRSRHHAVHAQIPLHPATHLRLSASAYQDACMTTSSPFSSTLTAVSGQAHLIDRFPACGSISRATHVSMYPCRCTDLEALQLLQRLQLASWNCAREYMALTSPRSHTFQVKQGCLLDCISSWEIQNLKCHSP